MPFGASPWQLLIVLLIVLVVFGAKRLPEIGRSLGSSAREFKDGISGKDDDAGADGSDPSTSSKMEEKASEVGHGVGAAARELKDGFTGKDDDETHAGASSADKAEREKTAAGS